MEEHEGFGFDEFSVEMGDFELTKKRNYHNCVWECTEGGSIDQRPIIHNGMILFGSFNRKFYALDLKTRKHVWSFEAQDRIGLCSPALFKDSVIFGSYDQNVYCLDTKTGKLLWKFRTRGEIASTGVVDDGIYYVTSRDQHLYAISCGDGSLIWKFSTMEPNVSAPKVCGDRVYFGSSDRNLYCLEKGHGRMVWKFEAEEEIVCITPFMIIGDLIFVGTMGTMFYAIDINTGRCVWKKDLGDYGITRGQTILKGMLIQPTEGGRIYAITPAGRIVWKVVKNLPFTSVTTDGERIYTGSEDLHYYCFDADGKVVWRFKMEGPVWQPSAIHDGVIYIGSYDCNLYALDITNGKLLWKFRCPGSPTTYPPLKSFFEISIKLPKKVFETSEEKKYELRLEDEKPDGTSAYKSRVTYQMSIQYQSRGGKYQVDSDEEAL